MQHNISHPNLYLWVVVHTRSASLPSRNYKVWLVGLYITLSLVNQCLPAAAPLQLPPSCWENPGLPVTINSQSTEHAQQKVLVVKKENNELKTITFTDRPVLRPDLTEMPLRIKTVFPMYTINDSQKNCIPNELHVSDKMHVMCHVKVATEIMDSSSFLLSFLAAWPPSSTYLSSCHPFPSSSQDQNRVTHGFHVLVLISNVGLCHNPWFYACNKGQRTLNPDKER